MKHAISKFVNKMFYEIQTILADVKMSDWKIYMFDKTQLYSTLKLRSAVFLLIRKSNHGVFSVFTNEDSNEKFG